MSYSKTDNSDYGGNEGSACGSILYHIMEVWSTTQSYIKQNQLSSPFQGDIQQF